MQCLYVRSKISNKLKKMTQYRMKVVNSTFKVPHEAVHVSYGSIGGGMLRDQHQCLTVVLQSLVVFSTETNIV